MEYQHNPEDVEDFSVSDNENWDGESKLPLEIELQLHELFDTNGVDHKDQIYWRQRASKIYNNAILGYTLGKEQEGKTVDNIDIEAYERVVDIALESIENEIHDHNKLEES